MLLGNCMPKKIKKDSISGNGNNLSRTKKLRVRFVKKMKKYRKIRNIDVLPQFPLTDDETDHLPCNTHSPQHSTGNVTDSMRQSIETVLSINTTSDVEEIRILIHGSKHASSQVTTIDPLRYETKGSELDCMILPLCAVDEESSEEMSIYARTEDDSNLYPRIDISFFDNHMGDDKIIPAVEATLGKLNQESVSMDAPSLVESEYDEDSSIDEDSMTEEMSQTIICNMEFPFNNDPEVPLENVSECPPKVIEGDFLDFDVRLSMELASSRKVALIQKRRIFSRRNRRIRVLISLIISTCLVMITICTYMFLDRITFQTEHALPLSLLQTE